MQARVFLALLLAAAIAGQLAAAAPASWSQEFVNRVYTASFPLVFGGDSYRWTGSGLALESSGRVYYEEFSSAPGGWRALSGSWAVSGGFLAASSPDPSSWGIYEYGDAIPASAGPSIFFEVHMATASGTRGGLSLSTVLGDTGDPQASPSVLVTVDAKAGAGMEVAPPLGDYPPVPPEDGDVWLRLVYHPAGSYEAFADVGGGWVAVHSGSTGGGDAVLRLVVMGEDEWRFGYVAVYRGSAVAFRGLPPGSVVQLYMGSRLVASGMADSAGEAVLDVSGEHIPLRGARVRVYIPPMTACYDTGARRVCSGAIGRFLAVAGEASVDIWYRVSLGEGVTLYSVRWVLPPAADVVNLTLVDGGEATAYAPDSVSTLGPFKAAVFSFPGGVSADRMVLYMRAPNIVSGFTLYSVDRGVENPAATRVGEDMECTISASDGSSPLPGARVALVVKRVPDAATLLTRTGSTGSGGEAVLGFAGPAYPYRAVGLAYYSPAGTEWYFGIAERPVRLEPSLSLSAPPEAAEGEPVRLVARLHAGARGVGGAAVAFQVRAGAIWVTVAAVETNSTGYAAVGYLPHGSGVLLVRAVYGGDAWHSPAASPPVEVSVKRRPLIVVEAPGSVTVARPFSVNVTLTYRGSPLPGKAVALQRSLDGSAWETVDTGVTGGEGTASFMVTEAAAGRYLYRAVFAGDGVYVGATSDAAAVEAALAAAELALSVPVANATIPVAVSARLTSGGSPLAGKPVAIRVNGTTLCTAATGLGGWARCVWIPPAPGTYMVEAVFGGDGEYGPARVEAEARVYGLSTRVYVAPTERVYAGREALLSLRLTLANGTPLPGRVEYRWRGGVGAVVLANGSGVIRLTFPSPGNYTLEARYPGSSIYAAASTRLVVEAERVPVRVSVEAPASAVEGGEMEVRVRVVDAFDEPVGGARVHVYLGGSGAASGDTGPDGVAVLRVPVGAAGRLPLRVVVEGGGVYGGVDADMGVVEAAPAPWKVALPLAAVLAAAAILLYRRRSAPGGAAVATPAGAGPATPPGGEALLVASAGGVARSPVEEEPLEACVEGCGGRAGGGPGP